MGWFARRFGKDPQAELARAEERLAAGRAYDALVIAEEVERRGGDDAAAIRRRARELEIRARGVLIGSALAEADVAEADEDYDDAADWVASALEHAVKMDELTAADRPPDDEGQTPALRARQRDLKRRGREAARQPSMMRRFEDDERPGPDPLHTEGTFGVLVGTLNEDIADLYFHRPLPFQKAYIDLNEGNGESALAAFDGLVVEEPDDAIVRFERGRARMLTEDYAGAQEDFKAAWGELGDDPLDVHGDLSVPLLWAEATQALGEPVEVAERLEPLADPRTGQEWLVVVRAHALREVGTPEARSEARTLLEEARPHQDGSRVTVALADIYRDQGERDRAIEILEPIVLPGCRGGSCSGLDAAAALLLARLYLERLEEGATEDPEVMLDETARVLGALAMSLGDLSAPETRELVDRYRRVAGSDEVPFPGAHPPGDGRALADDFDEDELVS